MRALKFRFLIIAVLCSCAFQSLQAQIGALRSSPKFGFGWWNEIALATDGGGDFQSYTGYPKIRVNGAQCIWNGKITRWLTTEASAFVGRTTYLYPENEAQNKYQNWGYGFQLGIIPRLNLKNVKLGLGPVIGCTFLNKQPVYDNGLKTDLGSSQMLGIALRAGFRFYKAWMVECRANYAFLGAGNYYNYGSHGFGIALVRMSHRKGFF